MLDIKTAEETLDTTVYEKEGLNSLEDFFKVILDAQKNGNSEVVKTSLSKLNDEEKESFVDWAKADTDFPEIVKIMIKGSLSKEAVDINKELYDSICYKLITNGFTLDSDYNGVNECCGPCDSDVPYDVSFSDNEFINGRVDYNCHKVHLSARDAKGKEYDKTIDYLDLDDLLESIFHFQKDIKETYCELDNQETGDWSDILNDKDFMASIGAEDVLNQK